MSTITSKDGTEIFYKADQINADLLAFIKG